MKIFSRLIFVFSLLVFFSCSEHSENKEVKNDNESIISQAQFDEYINSGKTVLIDYNATWCAPCKMQAPIVEKIAQEKGDNLIFLSIDVDKNMEIARAQNIEALPTLVVYKGGKATWKNVGLTDRENILQAIE